MHTLLIRSVGRRRIRKLAANDASIAASYELQNVEWMSAIAFNGPQECWGRVPQDPKALECRVSKSQPGWQNGGNGMMTTTSATPKTLLIMMHAANQFCCIMPKVCFTLHSTTVGESVQWQHSSALHWAEGGKSSENWEENWERAATLALKSHPSAQLLCCALCSLNDFQLFSFLCVCLVFGLHFFSIFFHAPALLVFFLCVTPPLQCHFRVVILRGHVACCKIPLLFSVFKWSLFRGPALLDV